MGKGKKRGLPDVDEVLQRPWCYYCERDFDDLKILISHQRAKHFKCERCHRRLNTVGGLSVHMNQVHKEQLTAVENSLPNRDDVSIEIFGMEGIPEDVLAAHHTRVTEAFFRSEAQRRALTGNPPPGGKQGSDGGVKKQKIESAEDIKKRLELHRAKREAEKAGLGSGDTTPANASQSPAPTMPEPQGFALPNSSPPPGYNPYQPPPQPGYPSYPGFAGSPSNQPPFPTPAYPYSPYGPNGPMSSGPPQMGYGANVPHSPLYPPFHTPVSGPPVSAPGMTPGLPQPSPGLPQRPAFGAPNLSKEEMAKMHAGAMQMSPNGASPFNGPPPQQMQVRREDIGDSVDELISSVTGQAPYSALHSRPLPSGSDPPSFPPDRRANPLPLHLRPEANAQPTASPDAGRAQTQTPANGRPDRVQNGTRDNASPVTPVPAPAMSTTQGEEAAPPLGAAAEKRKKKSKHHDEASKLVYRDKIRSPEEKLAHKAKYAFNRNAHEHTQTVLGDISGALTGSTGETVKDPADSSV